MYVIQLYGRERFWVEGQGWATTKHERATQYTESEARNLALRLHAEAVETL